MRSLLLLTSLAGCGAAVVPARAGDPLPAVDDGIARDQLLFDGAGGKLYARSWRPRDGNVRGVLAIHHGLVDHCARYAMLAERLAKSGYAVWALDMRGHAHSTGTRVQIDRIDDLLDDLDRFLALVREREPGKPTFLLGHSLGGLAAALYAIERVRDPSALAGVIVSAPGIAFDAPAVQLGAVRLVAAIAPNARVLETPHAQFSSSPEVVAELGRDPLITQGNGPARTARAATDGVARVWARADQLRIPLLAVHGTNDTITSPTGSRDLVARAGTQDRTLRLYDGLRHDLLHEPNGGAERVATDLHAWLDAHTGAAATLTSSTTALPERRTVATFVELDARGERGDDATGATAGLRLRVAVGRIGYAGGVDLRGGHLDGGHYEADLHALGLGLRSSGGAQLAITGGIGIGGVRGASATHLPVEAALEVPLGPTRVLARAGIAWRLSGDDYAGDALGIADEASALVGLRLGRDRRYWARVIAGAGPYVAATYRNFGGEALYGVVLGAQLWGGN